MQTFSVSGNDWFDHIGQPVLLLGERGIKYSNKAAQTLFRTQGIQLLEGEALPAQLMALPNDADVVTEIQVSGFRYAAEVRAIEAGRLVQLRRKEGETVFSNERMAEMAERLRNPMSNLLSAAELLTRELAEQDQPKMNRYMAVLNRSYCRLLRLVNHLGYTHVLGEDTDESFQPQVLDLAGICREVGRQMSGLEYESGRAFGWVDHVGSLLVKGDSDLLSHMLYQLISNAWKSGGDVTMEVDRLGSRGVITVSDNGGGMTQEALWDAFDPGASRNSLLADEGGLGLGIPICQHIAAAHGGTLVLESRPGKGVSAIVSLPVCSMAESMEVHTSRHNYDISGGFFPMLTELSEVLPTECFLPQNLE